MGLGYFKVQGKVASRDGGKTLKDRYPKGKVQYGRASLCYGCGASGSIFSKCKCKGKK